MIFNTLLQLWTAKKKKSITLSQKIVLKKNSHKKKIKVPHPKP